MGFGYLTTPGTHPIEARMAETNLFVGALFLQHVRGFSAFGTGLAFLPTTLVLGVLSAGITAKLMGAWAHSGC